MKLAVSNWYPYQHQATALEQVARGITFERVPLESIASPLVDPALGPFLAVVDDETLPALVGIPAVIEALARAYPEWGLLPADPYERARVRGLAAKIEECFTRLTVADVATHADFGRRIWMKGSEAKARMLDDLPMRLTTLEAFEQSSTSRFLVGDAPTLADCLFAATVWTLEDMGLAEHLSEHRQLSAWRDRNCGGNPFFKADR